MSVIHKSVVLSLVACLFLLSGCFGLEDAQKKKVREQKLANLKERGCPAYLAKETGRVKFKPWEPPAKSSPRSESIDRLAAGAPKGRSTYMRVLLVGRDKKDVSFKTAQKLLTNYGVPHTAVLADRGSLPKLEMNGVGRYQAIFISSSEIVHGSKPSSAERRGGNRVSRARLPLLEKSERKKLRSYEKKYKAREATLSLASSIPGVKVVAMRTLKKSSRPLPADNGPTLRLTALGRQELSYLPGNFESPIGAEPIHTTKVSNPVRPLLVTQEGTVGALMSEDRLQLTYEQGYKQITTLAVFPAVLSWATRGVYIGELRPILVVQIDDVLIPNFRYGGGTYRLRPRDIRALADWTKKQKKKPLTRGFRLDMVFNATQASHCDKLTKALLADRDLYNWTDHTYEHLNLDRESENETFEQVKLNNRAAKSLKLPRYDPRVLVTGEHSGLKNRDAMLGAKKAGVNIVAANTAETDQRPKYFNELIPNFVVPEIKMVPRIPTNLETDVGTRDEWLTAYNEKYSDFWKRDLAYEEMLSSEVRQMLQPTLRGNWGPFFFHQINLRAYDRRNSTLTDLLDHFFVEYGKRSKQPLPTPTYQEVAKMMQERQEFRLCSPVGLVENSKTGSPDRVRIVAGRTCRVPVTGIGRRMQVGVKPSVLRVARMK